MLVANVKELTNAIPHGATVAVKLSNDVVVNKQYRGRTLFGFWKGIYPDPKIHPAVRSPVDGQHWVAHIVDPGSDDLVWDIHLRVIETIDIINRDIRDEIL